MSAENPFTAAKLVAMREEIHRDGLLTDKFLATDPDCPTFGLNLACAWLFPEAWRESYERMARQLSELGPDCYVYPFPFTHITLVTFVSFARHTRPASQLVKTLEGKIPNILEAPSPLFAEDSSEQIKRFTLQPQLLVLARGSGILSLLNPDGEVERLRHGTMELLRRNEPLHHELTGRGLNMPGINHSTVTRFRRVPPNLEKFLTAFDEIATETNFQPMQVREILLTSETKAYMRGGEILRRFRLADQ